MTLDAVAINCTDGKGLHTVLTLTCFIGVGFGTAGAHLEDIENRAGSVSSGPHASHAVKRPSFEATSAAPLILHELGGERMPVPPSSSACTRTGSAPWMGSVTITYSTRG